MPKVIIGHLSLWRVQKIIFPQKQCSTAFIEYSINAGKSNQQFFLYWITLFKTLLLTKMNFCTFQVFLS